jgi:hypothetical protein
MTMDIGKFSCRPHNEGEIVKLIGFFREVPYGEKETGKESLFEAAQNRGDYDTASVTAYLTSGHPILDVMEVTSDSLGGKFHSPGGSSIATDGEYAWRLDLAEYVRHYRINLPQDFIQWMEDNSYEIPEVTRKRLIDISTSVNQLLGFDASPGTTPR